MNNPQLSIVIPYKQRLDNLRTVFTSLAEQTIERSRFEVVVGVMEYATEYVRLCQEFANRIRIVSVLVDQEWNTSRARNLGIRQACGEVIVVLDADVVLAPTVLRTLYDRYFQHQQNVCVLGQVVGYDEVLDSAEVRPYEHCSKALAELATTDRSRLDPRWSAEYASAFARFPWAFARTGFMALPTAAVRQCGLLLDEGFLGWGPEDQEWALRIAKTGMPLVLGQDVYGLHLPHQRDFSAQDRSATMGNRYYLTKWPRLDLELALTFGGWLEADRLYADVERELAKAGAGHPLGIVRGSQDGSSILVLGAVLDERVQLADAEVNALFDVRCPLEVLPLAGFAIPYSDNSVDECRILAPISRLSERYRNAIYGEAERVSRKLVAPAGDDRR